MVDAKYLGIGGGRRRETVLEIPLRSDPSWALSYEWTLCMVLASWRASEREARPCFSR